MEPMDSQSKAPCKTCAASRYQKEGNGGQNASDNSNSQALGGEQISPNEALRCPVVRTRRARPGAHFQAPQVSSRSNLAHCNTLFPPSTLRSPCASCKTTADINNARPVARGHVQRAEACAGREWQQRSQQSRSAATDSSQEGNNQTRNLGTTSLSSTDGRPIISGQDARVQQSTRDHFRSQPKRPEVLKSRSDASSGNRALLPAALYLKALKQVNAATSGQRISSAAARNADISMKGAPPLKIFCGTWNCQYQDFPVSVLTNRATASRLREGLDTFDSETSSSASPNSPPQQAEGLPEELPADVLAELDGDFEPLYESQTGGAPGLNGRVTSQPNKPSSGESPVRRATIKRGDLVRSSTRLLREVEGEDQPLGDWLLPGYDVYIVSLQETLGQSIFDTVTVYLTTTNGVSFKRIKFQDDKLSGLGDGAWMQFKSTSLAVWAREDLEGEGMPVSFVSSKAASVSFLSGSKGGVSVCLRIWNQLFCFIGCHMPSTSPEDRRKARAVVEQRLLEFYGGANSWRAAFHHVLWMGDFNFRTQRMTTQRAVTLLKQSPTGLLAFDEWIGPNGEDMRTAGFAEAPISFPPTYKKADGRPPANMSHPRWVDQEYQTHMITQWYKGSRHQDRIPSWTDRIFKCSVAEVSSLVRFQPNQYFCAMPSRPSFLIASDHSPVGLGLECFPLDTAYVLPAVTSDNSISKKTVKSGDSRGIQARTTVNGDLFVDV